MPWAPPTSGPVKRPRQPVVKVVQLAAVAPRAAFKRRTDNRKKAGSILPAFFLSPAQPVILSAPTGHPERSEGSVACPTGHPERSEGSAACPTGHPERSEGSAA